MQEGAARQASRIQLRSCFADPLLNSMNFLNEIVMEYPNAISFAPGRPAEELFDVADNLRAIEVFVAWCARQERIPERQVWERLGQYGRTNGSIQELIAWQIESDEDIRIPPEAIMVTVGAQEAMAIILTGLFDPAHDVLLASDPTYIGITALARVLGIRVLPVPSDDDGMCPDALERAIQQCFRVGSPRAVYDIPDFNNPLGTRLSASRRLQILKVCRRHDLLFIEDNPYGMFSYEGEKVPTMKALDDHGTVLYIGSFSKTLFPGLRLGYLIADQAVDGPSGILAQELSKVKSLLTVNTSPLLQAIAGGILLMNAGSLRGIVSAKSTYYRRNRDVMLESLQHHFSDMKDVISWNRPGGGFFLTLKLPFSFTLREVRHCAAEYGVIVCPMSMFSLTQTRQREIRLAFSYTNENQVREGIKRLAAFIKGCCVELAQGTSTVDLRT
jgi:(S)-3,5-dihydroxyphenylglycine transaminase